MHAKWFTNSPRRTVLAALLIGACLAGAPAFAQRDADNALAAARRDFSQFTAHQLTVRPGSAPLDFPLEVSDMQDLSQATIGPGFQIYTVDAQELMAGRGDLQAMAKPTGQWRFIISLHGKPIGMATVENVNGQFSTVAYGASVLAKDTDAAMAYYGNSARSNLRFLRIYQARADFLEVSGQADGRPRYAALHSARESLLMEQRAAKQGEPAAQLLDGSELLQPLRSAVKANIEAFR
jgi:hypothetical protein